MVIYHKKIISQNKYLYNTYRHTSQIKRAEAAVVIKVKGMPIFSHWPKFIDTPCLRSMPTATTFAEAPKGVRFPPRQEPISRANM